MYIISTYRSQTRQKYIFWTMWFWPLIYKILNERHFWPSRGRQIKEKIEKYRDSKVWVCGKGSVKVGYFFWSFTNTTKSLNKRGGGKELKN